MEWSWSLWGFVGLVAFPLGLIVAALVFRNAPDRRMNRRLAFLIFVESLVIGLNGGITYLAEDAASARAARVAGAVAMPWLVIGYVRLLSLLESPLKPILESRFVNWIIGVFAVVFPALVLSESGFFVGLVPGQIGAWDAGWLGPVATVAFLTVFGTYLLGLITSLLAWRAAPRGSTRRVRAAWFLVAFGVRDGAFAVVMPLWAIGAQTGINPINVDYWGNIALNLAPFIAMMMLTYGMIRYQVLDIDLHIKWTISRGTLAAIFLAVFFVVGTIASEFLVDRLGFGIGGLAAGLLLFAINPLQRLGERVANVAMPGVQDTPEYRARRSVEVYQAAWEGMLADGNISEKEKDVLAALATDLGLDPGDVRSIEKAASGGHH